MDTNNKIIGIVFEIDKEARSALIEKGVSPDEATRLAAKTAMIFHQDRNTHEYINLNGYADNAKITEVNKCYSRALRSNTSREEINCYYTGDPVLDDAKRRAQNGEAYLTNAEIEEAKKEASEKTKNRIKAGAIITTSVAAAILLACLASCGIKKWKEKEDSQETIESQQEFTGWLDYYRNMENGPQKELWVNRINKWLTANKVEDWQKVTLTSEEMEALGYTDKECVFGFTADEAYSLALKFNYYTEKDYVQITGAELDINAIDIASDKTFEKIRTYYFHSDECSLEIDKLIDFSEAGNKAVKGLEALLAEHKALDKEEGKEEEAKAKMIEMKARIVAAAFDKEIDDNAKAYILATLLPVAEQISNMHQYQDTIELDVYDTKTDKTDTIKIKTTLFDEITMRRLNLGFDGFDSEAYLENNNKDSNRYNFLSYATEKSVMDKLFTAQNEKLKDAKDYIDVLLISDKKQEEYDELTENTIAADSISEVLDKFLKSQNKYPKNEDYFLKNVSEKIKEFKNTHGETKGEKVGDVVKEEQKTQAPTTPGSLSAPNNTVVNDAGQKITAEESMETAKEENNEQDDNYDYDTSGDTDEEKAKKEQEAEEEAAKSEAAAQRAVMLQNVYEQTYDFIYSGDTDGYDSSWASSSDPEVVDRHNTALAQATSRKEQEAATKKENEAQQNQNPGIDYIPGFENAEMYDQPQTPVPSVNNTTPAEPTPEPIVQPTPEPTTQPTAAPTVQPTPEPTAQPDFDYSSGFEGAEIEGGLIIGGATVVQSTSDLDLDFDFDIDSNFANMTDEEWAAFVANGAALESQLQTDPNQLIKTK